MALHDYQCIEDGTVLVDQFRTVEEGAQANPPLCPTCGNRMAWVPQVMAMDTFDVNQKFTMYDGQNRPVTVESVAQMRKLERESEQQARNGEGQPIRFRALHQTKGNMQDNTFGDIPSPKIDAEAKRKFGLRGGAKSLASSGDDQPDHAFGPGVNEANCSALKD